MILWLIIKKRRQSRKCFDRVTVGRYGVGMKDLNRPRPVPRLTSLHERRPQGPYYRLLLSSLLGGLLVVVTACGASKPPYNGPLALADAAGDMAGQASETTVDTVEIGDDTAEVPSADVTATDSSDVGQEDAQPLDDQVDSQDDALASDTALPVDTDDALADDATDNDGGESVSGVCSFDKDCAGFANIGACQLLRCLGGQCVVANQVEGTPCSAAQCLDINGQPVLSARVCSAGACSDKVLKTSCYDNLGCTDDSCSVSKGCIHTPNHAACDDGQACTSDICDGTGGCQHGAATGNCNDGDPCTTGDSCLNGTCQGTPGSCPCTKNSDCKTTKPCVQSVCESGSCQIQFLTSSLCSDGNACTGSDTCTSDGSCVGLSIGCDDGVDCTLDLCDNVLGCQHLADSLQCADGNSCTQDSCTASDGCTFSPVSSGSCDDGNACTTEDVCIGGLCYGNNSVCNKPSACQAATCDPGTGLCKTALAVDGALCDDANPCSAKDTCKSGSCVGQQNPCDDLNACTFDACGAGGSCSHSPQDGPCDADGNQCTLDTCSASKCQAGPVPTCNDKNPCTVDSCDPASGCVAKASPVGTPCGSGLWCGQGGQKGTCVTVPAIAGMVYVPAGEFKQGCNKPVDNYCKTDENPAHVVDLSSYFIGKTEVTASQYAACVQTGGCSVPGGKASSDGTYGVAGKEQHPVNYVSYSQAGEFCAWSGGRLCTEAEWEMAARGSDGREFPWGNGTPDCGLAIFAGCSTKGTQPAGKAANGSSPYGALDMAGNVREWVGDWYGAGAYAAAASVSPASNPKGPVSGSQRVLRGGYFADSAPDLRTSGRSFATPSTSAASVGFRCCRNP